MEDMSGHIALKSTAMKEHSVSLMQYAHSVQRAAQQLRPSAVVNHKCGTVRGTAVARKQHQDRGSTERRTIVHVAALSPLGSSDCRFDFSDVHTYGASCCMVQV